MSTAAGSASAKACPGVTQNCGRPSNCPHPSPPPQSELQERERPSPLLSLPRDGGQGGGRFTPELALYPACPHSYICPIQPNIILCQVSGITGIPAERQGARCSTVTNAMPVTKQLASGSPDNGVATFQAILWRMKAS